MNMGSGGMAVPYNHEAPTGSLPHRLHPFPIPAQFHLIALPAELPISVTFANLRRNQIVGSICVANFSFVV
jgi:hypothetical protein